MIFPSGLYAEQNRLHFSTNCRVQLQRALFTINLAIAPSFVKTSYPWLAYGNAKHSITIRDMQRICIDYFQKRLMNMSIFSIYFTVVSETIVDASIIDVNSDSRFRVKKCSLEPRTISSFEFVAKFRSFAIVEITDFLPRLYLQVSLKNSNYKKNPRTLDTRCRWPPKVFQYWK